MGPVFAIDAPFTLLAREKLVSSELPSTDIEDGGRIIRTTTRSIIERNYFGMATQVFRRTEIEERSAESPRGRAASGESHETLLDASGKNALLRLPLSMATVIFYFVLQVLAEGWLMRGASPGKVLMGIRVSPVRGAAMDLNRAAMRNLCKILSLGSLFAGVLMAFWSKKRQMLHDMLAGAYVHDAG
jgi:hypothetical protein